MLLDGKVVLKLWLVLSILFENDNGEGVMVCFEVPVMSNKASMTFKGGNVEMWLIGSLTLKNS